MLQNSRFRSLSVCKSYNVQSYSVLLRLHVCFKFIKHIRLQNIEGSFRTNKFKSSNFKFVSVYKFVKYVLFVLRKRVKVLKVQTWKRCFEYFWLLCIIWSGVIIFQCFPSFRLSQLNSNLYWSYVCACVCVCVCRLQRRADSVFS